MTDNEQIDAMMEAAEMYQRQHETNGGNEMNTDKKAINSLPGEMETQLYAIYVDDGYGIDNPWIVPLCHVRATSYHTARKAFRARYHGSYAVTCKFRATRVR